MGFGAFLPEAFLLIFPGYLGRELSCSCGWDAGGVVGWGHNTLRLKLIKPNCLF